MRLKPTEILASAPDFGNLFKKRKTKAMMQAVARKKAHWLFNIGSDSAFIGKRRLQEDMVTSAVFGSIRLMSPEDRREAIKVMVGGDCFTAAGFKEGEDIDHRNGF
ncbi:MAG: hypothetical protein CSA68_03020 [Rhodobacterales bacterium]|nr:MAG: hypothetical protein CSA68_03020 [Rhodobacterales bacterium]